MIENRPNAVHTGHPRSSPVQTEADSLTAPDLSSWNTARACSNPSSIIGLSYLSKMLSTALVSLLLFKVVLRLEKPFFAMQAIIF